MHSGCRRRKNWSSKMMIIWRSISLICAIRSSKTFRTLTSTSQPILVARRARVEFHHSIVIRKTWQNWTTLMKSYLQRPFQSTNCTRRKALTVNWSSYWIRKAPSRRWIGSWSKTSGARARRDLSKCKRRLLTLWLAHHRLLRIPRTLR